MSVWHVYDINYNGLKDNSKRSTAAASEKETLAQQLLDCSKSLGREQHLVSEARPSGYMADSLSHSKRKFIERWRKSVGHYITNGGLCKVTITDVPPEEGAITPSSEHSRSMASHSPLPAEIMEHFPAIRQTESLFDRKGHQHIRKTNSGRNRLRLPPSPNGMLVHNGPDINKSLLLNTLPKRANELASRNKRPDADTSKDTKRISKTSSKVAKEIFDKYNMKSEAQNMLPGKHIYNGFQQLSMPWRNKTFLTLPIRFNGNIRMKNAKYLDSDQLSISSRNVDFDSNASVVSSEFNDWAGGE